ncbi:uncharacterized protein IWZ02DRAFT_376398 [Phyllosticta citriasiana]|uniref:Mitochondrial inner membrane protein 1 n=1 Tax=Phyllosticta citriasiana TaxID=595635 RepID=A0ABR1KPF8_9PEZI
MPLRNPASRSILRSLRSAHAPHLKTTPTNATFNPPLTSKLCTVSRRPQAGSTQALKPILAVATRYQRYSSPVDKINVEEEKRLSKEKLEPHPEEVSTTSSIHPIFSEVKTPEPEKDPDMMKGMKSDIDTIRETFSLKDVPHQAYVLGMAGVLPYLATSLSTVYCAYEINHGADGSAINLLSPANAELFLHMLEPLQVGYGAVIISFLGAIHWGLEWAGFGGHQGYRRYAIGVFAPAVAWPTILLPVEYALITQFVAFNFLYYADARATVRGWTPAWYTTYRFVLTFIVGASIVVSLIGRGQIVEKVGKLPNPVDRVLQLKETAEAALEKEEAARRAAIEAREAGSKVQVPGGDPEVRTGMDEE